MGTALAKRLGHKPDAAIAKWLNTTSAEVSSWRRSLGINPAAAGTPQTAAAARAVVLETLGRFPVHTAEIHQRVLKVWGDISKRQVGRHLVRLCQEGAVEAVRAQSEWMWRRKR